MNYTTFRCARRARIRIARTIGLHFDLPSLVSKHLENITDTDQDQDGYEFNLWLEPWIDRPSKMVQNVWHGFISSQNTDKCGGSVRSGQNTFGQVSYFLVFKIIVE